ncbi:MAG: hypothetical protein COA58_03845 [Bacteroidetes bacterium]|nr:MAG: hypothetical protein COA58_03845 [Bacteroidota bacterium]
MREAKANLAINNLLKDVTKKFDADKTVAQLADIRILALEEEEPTVVKICRLASAYITEKKNFDLGYVAEEEIGDMTDMQYLLELMLKVDRSANREEIQEIRDKIKEELS